MPIDNLSEVVRMPRLGKFHLGIKDPVKGYPIKTDYFVIPKDHQDYAKIVKLFGEKPKELRVLIPSEDIEEWAPQYYKAYNMTYGLVCKGDGKTAMRMVDIKTKELPNKATGTTTMIDLDCKGKECPFYKDKKCGETMNLHIVLPDVPGLGVWQIDTGSINSILNINSCAKLIKIAFGRISNIPLKLTLEPISVNNPENGKKQTVYVLNLRSDVTLAQLAEAARLQSKTFMLEAPDMAAAWDAQVEKAELLWDSEQNPEGEAAKHSVKKNPQTPPAAPVVSVTPPKQTNEGNVKGEQEKSIIDLAWLEESLKTLQEKGLKAWSNAATVRYLISITHQESKSVSDAAYKLNREQAEAFVKKVQEALELA